MENTLNSSSAGHAAAHIRDGTDEELIIDSHLTMSGMYCRAINGANILSKECGDISLCKHGRRGASICEHGRHRSSCKECGGASICEHGRQLALAARNVEARRVTE